jgi:hypothetical protein
VARGKAWVGVRGCTLVVLLETKSAASEVGVVEGADIADTNSKVPGSNAAWFSSGFCGDAEGSPEVFLARPSLCRQDELLIAIITVFARHDQNAAPHLGATPGSRLEGEVTVIPFQRFGILGEPFMDHPAGIRGVLVFRGKEGSHGVADGVLTTG